jgi:hypothetical protein
LVEKASPVRVRPGLVVGGIVFIAAAVYIARDLSNRTERERLEEVRQSVFEISPDQISAVTVERPSETIQIELQSGHWRLTRPEQAEADPASVGAVLRLISSSTILQTVEESAVSPERYGLGPSGARLIVRSDEGGEMTVVVGVKAPTEKGVYLKRKGSSDVFLATDELADIAGLNPALLLERILLPGATEIDLLSVKTPAHTITVSRERDGWVLQEPYAFPGDRLKIEELLGALAKSKMLVTDRQPGSLSEAGLDPPRIEVVGLLGIEERVVFFGDMADEGRAWARRGSAMRLFAAEMDPLSLLSKAPQAWSEMRPAGIDRYRAIKLHVRVAGQKLSLIKSGEDWRTDQGQQVPRAGVLGLLAALFDVRAKRIEVIPALQRPSECVLVAEVMEEGGRDFAIDGWGPDSGGRWRVQPRGYEPALIMPENYLDTVRRRIEVIAAQ